MYKSTKVQKSRSFLNADARRDISLKQRKVARVVFNEANMRNAHVTRFNGAKVKTYASPVSHRLARFGCAATMA
jgi:hypothetical protein